MIEHAILYTLQPSVLVSFALESYSTHAVSCNVLQQDFKRSDPSESQKTS